LIDICARARLRAGVAVVTWEGVVCIDTPGEFITDLVGANIVVIASQHSTARDTHLIDTGVANGAEVVVRAGVGVAVGHATQRRQAIVVRARIIVGADRRDARLTTILSVARFVPVALVVVEADQCRTVLATRNGIAELDPVAHVAVVTCEGVVCVDTPGDFITAIVGADIAVITVG
jgi:hypothetical protein